MVKYLIANSDDFGISEDVSRGIMDARYKNTGNILSLVEEKGSFILSYDARPSGELFSSPR